MYKYVKRLLDLVISMVALIVLLPLFLIIIIFELFFMGLPIFYGQERIGYKEKTFKLYKFRSMTNAVDDDGNLLDEKKRLTRFGAFLRSSSIDEIPELWSILIGKMSLVGPRPLPTYYLPFMHDDERKRHNVRGGLIPPDSLSGKAYTTWEEQFEYEVNYSSNVTFSKDMKIIIMTFKILVKRFNSKYGEEFRPHLNEYRSHEKIK